MEKCKRKDGGDSIVGAAQGKTGNSFRRVVIPEAGANKQKNTSKRPPISTKKWVAKTFFGSGNPLPAGKEDMTLINSFDALVSEETAGDQPDTRAHKEGSGSPGGTEVLDIAATEQIDLSADSTGSAQGQGKGKEGRPSQAYEEYLQQKAREEKEKHETEDKKRKTELERRNGENQISEEGKISREKEKEEKIRAEWEEMKRKATMTQSGVPDHNAKYKNQSAPSSPRLMQAHTSPMLQRKQDGGLQVLIEEEVSNLLNE